MPADPIPRPKFNRPTIKTDESSLMVKIGKWSLVALAVAAIGWMIWSNPPQKRLNCSKNSGETSLIGFGSCSDEQ